MTFQEALEHLGIKEYGERIFKSNSHGELFHCADYITIAKAIPKDDTAWFKPWFEEMIKHAEKTWERPESVFQHVIKMLTG